MGPGRAMRTRRTVAWWGVGLAAGLMAWAACPAIAHDGSPSVGMPSAASIVRSQTHERAVELLLQAAQSSNPELRANAIEALSVSPSRLSMVASSALRDDSPGVRAVAAMAVGRARLREFVDDVRPLVGDANPFVQASAIGAMSMLGDPVNPTALADMVLTASSARVRAHAAYVLGEMGDRSAIRMLKEAARARIPRSTEAELRLFRLQVAEALAKLGEDDAVQAVRAALYPSRPEELEGTALAVQILGTLGERGAIDELMRLSERTDEAGGMMPAEIRLATAIALAQMGERDGWFIAERYYNDPAPGVRAQAAIVYGWTRGARNLSRLERMMGDSDERVRMAAAAGVLRLASRGD